MPAAAIASMTEVLTTRPRPSAPGRRHDRATDVAMDGPLDLESTEDELYVFDLDELDV